MDATKYILGALAIIGGLGLTAVGAMVLMIILGSWYGEKSDYEQRMEDEEQMRALREWSEKKKAKKLAKQKRKERKANEQAWHW